MDHPRHRLPPSQAPILATTLPTGQNSNATVSLSPLMAFSRILKREEHTIALVLDGLGYPKTPPVHIPGEDRPQAPHPVPLVGGAKAPTQTSGRMQHGRIGSDFTRPEIPLTLLIKRQLISGIHISSPLSWCWPCSAARPIMGGPR